MTHQLTCLPHVDVIIVLGNGDISEIGTFTELVAKNGSLARLVAKYAEDHPAAFDQGTKLSFYNNYSMTLYQYITIVSCCLLTSL